VILVNFEDHIEIVMMPQTTEMIGQSFRQLKKLVAAFDKVGFAVDAFLGYLTTSPLNLGTGLKL
jgi:protein-arginine kinase